MAKKQRRGRNAEIENLATALTLNGKAIEEDRKRKHWSIKDLRTIHPLTPTQEDMFHAWYNDKNICAHGSAGTGKTFLALYLALQEVLEQRYQRIIIVRSAVSTREIGHLPGTYEEKIAQYELPYQDVLYELIGRYSTYNDMKDAGLIEFMTTSFIRGLTWDNAIVIVDESENLTFHEINSVMTRIGDNTRVIIAGDITQTDLDGRKHGSTGIGDAMNVIGNMNHFETIQFSREDIIRSEFVRSWIIATESISR